MSVRVRVFFLFYSFTVPFSNTTSMFFTIFKYKFSSILFRGTIFLDGVVKMHFHLMVLMFSWQKIDCFLKGVSVRVRVFFLFCSFTVPFSNTTSMFFTIFKYKFSSILFQGTIFLDGVVKMHFHLMVLMFSWQKPSVSHVHQFSERWKVH
jgi:hypothetical protein